MEAALVTKDVLNVYLDGEGRYLLRLLDLRGKSICQVFQEGVGPTTETVEVEPRNMTIAGEIKTPDHIAAMFGREFVAVEGCSRDHVMAILEYETTRVVVTEVSSREPHPHASRGRMP